MVITCSIIPPKLGIAIGNMISDPLPVLVSTGSNASIVVAVVIMAGLTLRSPPSTMASLISDFVLGVFFLKLSFKNVATRTPSIG